MYNHNGDPYHMKSNALLMALLSGVSLPISGRVYEFPDLGVVRKAIRAAVEAHEESTPLRSARRPRPSPRSPTSR